MPKLFPKSVSAFKGVEGKHAHEENGENAKYSRSPMEEFDTPIQSSAGLPQTIEKEERSENKGPVGATPRPTERNPREVQGILRGDPNDAKLEPIFRFH